jgi:hypothetical protein
VGKLIDINNANDSAQRIAFAHQGLDQDLGFPSVFEADATGPDTSLGPFLVAKVAHLAVFEHSPRHYETQKPSLDFHRLFGDENQLTAKHGADFDLQAAVDIDHADRHIRARIIPSALNGKL